MSKVIWNAKELSKALQVARDWAAWQAESLDDFHAYAQQFGCQPGGNIFDFVMTDALRTRGMTWQQFHAQRTRVTDPSAMK